mgnify:CR=1 FL=1
MKVFLNCIFAVMSVLAGLSLYSHIAATEIEASHPPTGSFIRLDTSQLHVVKEGKGPALVLIHGATTTLYDFTASIFEPLAEHCQVLALDRPGHGYSSYPDTYWLDPEQQAIVIHQALQQIGIEQSVWVGHSWGGSVVMAGLLRYPGHVSSGVLLGGAAYPWQGGVDWSNHMADTPIVGPLITRTLLIPTGLMLMDSAINEVFYPDSPPQDYRQETAIELILRPDHFTVNGRDVRYLSQFLEKQSLRYSAIRQPVLIIHGEDDDIVPAWNHADRLIKVLPNAILEELPRTGHAPHHTQQGLVVELIKQFACEMN